MIEALWFEHETRFLSDAIFVNHHSLISLKMVQYRCINITHTSLQELDIYIVPIYVFLVVIMKHDYGRIVKADINAALNILNKCSPEAGSLLRCMGITVPKRLQVYS